GTNTDTGRGRIQGTDTDTGRGRIRVHRNANIPKFKKRIPLSQFLVDVLDHFHIYLSQLSVFGAAKVSHFEILCHVHGFQPSVNCFRMFYTSSCIKGWMSFIKRFDAALVCHSKLIDSVKNWNDHFLWVDSTAFPLFVSLKSKILSKDPLPSFLDMIQKRVTSYTLIMPHSGNFRNLSYAGLVKMDLFAFIRHSDPTKVRIGERDLAKREVKLLKMTKGRTVSLDPPDTAASGGSNDSIDKLFDEGDDAGQEHSVEKDDDVLDETIARDFLNVAIEKAKKNQKRKVTKEASGSTHPSKKLRDDYYGVTEPLIAAFVAPTPDVGPIDSMSRSLVSDASVVTVAVTTTVVANVAAIPGSKARVESKNLEDVRDFHLLVGLIRIRPLYFEFNVGAVRQACLEAERDVDIVYVKSLLSLKEVEAVEDIRLCGQLTTVKVADAAKDIELRDLKEKNFVFERERDVMSEKITTLKSTNAAKEAELATLLKSAFELFSACMKAMQDEQARVLETAIGCVVNKGIRDGLRAAVGHGKAGRDLLLIKAYDPSVVHSRVQRVKGEIIEKHLSLTDVMAPLAKPLSSRSLIGEPSTSASPVTTKLITTLSTTLAYSDVIPTLETSNNQALDTKSNDEDPLP
nr:hypothetical protein [Tanacetum cinerariifolium]